jgi:glucose-6-phosphate 1-epimerase
MPDSLEIPGHLTLVAGNGDLPKAVVTTPWSQAEIYLHGAHVTHFQKTGEPPLLFMSAVSQFSNGNPIRGGVPIIFPWFGPREGFSAHGYARTRAWELKETALLSNGAVTLRFELPGAEGFEVGFLVTITDTLQMELIVTNTSTEVATIENCLHTYFNISDIAAISIVGLEGITYLDKLSSTRENDSGQIQISSEVDRVYNDTPASVEIIDLGFKRSIRVEKSGSDSTIVWNPWIEKSKRMADFGDNEYPHMVCVESGNVGENTLALAPGEKSVLWVQVSSV